MIKEITMVHDDYERASMKENIYLAETEEEMVTSFWESYKELEGQVKSINIKYQASEHLLPF